MTKDGGKSSWKELHRHDGQVTCITGQGGLDSPHRGRKAHRLWPAVGSIWTRCVMPHLCPLASPRALECCRSHGSKHGQKAAQTFPVEAKQQAAVWARVAVGATRLRDRSSLFPCVQVTGVADTRGFHSVRKPRKLELSTESLRQKPIHLTSKQTQ